MKDFNIADFAEQQIVAISKAGAYDALSQNYGKLQEENKLLKERVKYLEDLIKEQPDKMLANLK